jgi:serine protease Do
MGGVAPRSTGGGTRALWRFHGLLGLWVLVLLGCAAACCCAVAAAAVAAAPSSELSAPPAVFDKPAPASIADVAAIERHVKRLVPVVSPTVVAIQIGGSTGSGVVVSSDGLILTAAHVAEEPNREARVVFPDGRGLRATTLGTNHELDAGMIRLRDAGPWPHVEVSRADAPKLGDWVLTLGHPGGYDPQRSLVVRFGRVIRVQDDAIQTDCTITAGDSGGPLFDMRGRVIGIHSRISNSTSENYHVPIRAFHTTWTRLVNGDNWGADPPRPRSWIGARGVDDPDGCRLETVSDGSPAQQAGVRAGDIVRAVNGRKIDGYAALRERVAAARPGDELRLELRRDGEDLSIAVKVAARPRRP